MQGFSTSCLLSSVIIGLEEAGGTCELNHRIEKKIGQL